MLLESQFFSFLPLPGIRHSDNRKKVIVKQIVCYLRGMFKKLKKAIGSNLDVIFVGLLMLCVFLFIIFVHYVDSDMRPHAEGARLMLQKHCLFRGNFLMYFVVNLLSGFSGSTKLTKFFLALLIALSNTGKYVIVREAFGQYCPKGIARLFSFALLFVFVIPILWFLELLGLYKNPMWLPGVLNLGYYVPNIWHNSTILCSMPFAILTYLLSLKQFDGFQMGRNGMIALFAAIGTLIKPSFFFTWMVAFPIVMFVRCRAKKEFWYSLIPVAICGICVLYEFFSVYFTPPLITIDPKYGDSSSSTIISIFESPVTVFWKNYCLHLLFVFLFPLVFVLSYWAEIRKDKEFWFVCILMIVAIGIDWFCHETGARAGHGNFSWQLIPCMWFVFYYILKVVVKSDFSIDENGLIKVANRGRLFLIIYLFHVLAGLWFLSRYLLTGFYC